MTAGTRSSTRFFLLLLVVLLSAGLVWGLTGAFATSPSASPGGKVILKSG
ncbi:MAG TPA: hypothetical protein VIL79_12165 [Thermoleophilia bacterium]